MFSTGQLVFAAICIVAFVIILIFSYRGDKNQHKKHYKNSFWVLIGFLIFLGFLFFMKIYLKD